MPVYTYKCPTCDEEYEKIHGMTEEMTEGCPIDGHSLVRIPSSVSVKQVNNVGNVVKEFIQANKELNNEEKQKLSNKEYK